MNRLIICGLALFIFSGCDIEYEPIEVIESTQRPDFILDMGTQVNDNPYPPLVARNTLCFWLNVPALLRVGDEANKITRHLSTYSVLTVENIAKSLDIMSNSPAGLKFMYDENNNLIGTYGDLNLCYGIDDLAVGVHPETFVTESTDGQAYSYSFELKVK